MARTRPKVGRPVAFRRGAARPPVGGRARARRRRPARGRRGAGGARRARARRSAPARDPGDLARAAARRARARRARPSLRRVLNATGVIVHTNLGRAPLAEEALARVVEVGARLLEPRARPARRRARLAAGSRRRDPAPAHRRRGRARRQQQRRRGAARARRARRGTRGGRLARRADRDRRRLPHPRRARALGRAARRGRDDEPHARRRLRARDRAGDGAAPARAPVELPRRRLHRAAAARGARRGRAPARPAARRRPRLRRPRATLAEASRPRSESLAAGADLVCFSGDKLLGGPQAGIVVGRADLVERLRRHPLQRALRADKLTLAALEGTLRALSRRRRSGFPCCACSDEDAGDVRARAERLASLVGGTVEETVGRVGGGALPLAELPSFACAVEEALAAPLRSGEPPVVGDRPRREAAARLPHARRRRGRRGAPPPYARCR